MEKSKKIKITLADSQRNTASDHTMRVGDYEWVRTSTNNNHIYFNDEWNGEYED